MKKLLLNNRSRLSRKNNKNNSQSKNRLRYTDLLTLLLLSKKHSKNSSSSVFSFILLVFRHKLSTNIFFCANKSKNHRSQPLQGGSLNPTKFAENLKNFDLQRYFTTTTTTLTILTQKILQFSNFLFPIFHFNIQVEEEPLSTDVSRRSSEVMYFESTSKQHPFQPYHFHH